MTFKNAARLREALHAVPPERLLIETDSPYMAPEPVRGQRNEPANVFYVMLRIAQEMQMDAEELSRITFENACRLYGIRDV